MTDEVIPTQSTPVEQPVPPTDATQQVAQTTTPQPPAMPETPLLPVAPTLPITPTLPIDPIRPSEPLLPDMPTQPEQLKQPVSAAWYKRLRGVHYAVAALVGAAFFGALAFSQSPKSTPVIPTPLPVASHSAALKAAIIPGVVCHAIHVVPNDPQAVLPDSLCTPGATNPAVTQATIGQTICTADYVATIRPPLTLTETLKRLSMRDYGFTDVISLHEEDHLIPLELGGAAASPNNLWAEPGATPNEKDKVENFLHAQVCAGKMPLAEAQRAISTNWYKVFLTL